LTNPTSSSSHTKKYNFDTSPNLVTLPEGRIAWCPSQNGDAFTVACCRFGGSYSRSSVVLHQRQVRGIAIGVSGIVCSLVVPDCLRLARIGVGRTSVRENAGYRGSRMNRQNEEDAWCVVDKNSACNVFESLSLSLSLSLSHCQPLLPTRRVSEDQLTDRRRSPFSAQRNSMGIQTTRSFSTVRAARTRRRKWWRASSWRRGTLPVAVQSYTRRYRKRHSRS